MRTIRSHSATVLFLTPWILTFLVFWLYPLGYALYLSFTKYQTLSNTATFVGLQNYRQLFEDSLFWTALGNTTLFSFGTIPFTTALALLFAVLFNGTSRLQEFFRSVFFLPSVTSLVVLSLIFTQLYSAGGYINTLLQFIGLPYPQRGWLQEPSAALPAVMLMDIWISTGYYMVLLLAALQTIPKDLYEAATLEGASAWQQFRTITLPLLRPALLFIIVINTIKSFQVFVEIYVMTKGGPLDATTTLVYLLYSSAFERVDMMGYACALGYVIFLITLVFSLVQMYLLQAEKVRAGA